MVKRLSLILVLLLVATTALSAKTRSFTLLEYGNLELDVPDGWKTTINKAGSASGPAFQFESPGNIPVILLVTPIPVPDGPKKLAQAVQETAHAIVREMRKVAVEDNLAIKELTGPHGRLLYASATDRTVDKPSAENFKYGDQGVGEIGEIMMTFTVLTNVKDSPERRMALEIVRSARHIPRRDGGGAPKEHTLHVSEKNNIYELSVPVSKLIMTLPKMDLLQKKMAVGGSTNSPRYFYFTGKKNHTVVSGWFESSQGYSGFNTYWKGEKEAWRSSNSLPAPMNERFFTSNGWDGVAYDTRITDSVTSHHIKAHLVQAGTWIDLHLSVTTDNGDTRSHDTLANILKSIEVTEK